MAKLLYVADLVERLGRASVEILLPAKITTVATLLAWLRGRGGAWGCKPCSPTPCASP